MCRKAVSDISGLCLTVFPRTPAKSGPKVASVLDKSLIITGQSLKVLCLVISLKLLSVGCPIIACTSLASVYSTGEIPHMRCTFSSYEVFLFCSKIIIFGMNYTQILKYLGNNGRNGAICACKTINFNI